MIKMVHLPISKNNIWLGEVACIGREGTNVWAEALKETVFKPHIVKYFTIIIAEGIKCRVVGIKVC